MSDEILAIGTWSTNATLIADVARLGYIEPDVLDVTYGQGGFWTLWQPERLITNDLYVAGAQLCQDYRRLSFASRSVGTVVFDPPYKLNGTPALAEQDDRYGTNQRTSRDEVLTDIACGALECWRVTRRTLLVKCMDQVEGGQKRWQTHLVTTVLAPMGATLIDRFDIGVAGRPQPGERTQRRSRSKHSTLLVFERRTRL